MFQKNRENRRRIREYRQASRGDRMTNRDKWRQIIGGLEFEMDTDRLGAFMDAVVAIIMTILVLELEKPEHMSWQALWDLRANFFAYILSFAWLGAMWINLHYDWKLVQKTTRKTAWAMMNLLLWSSFLPYATNIMARDFNNSTAQIFYGIIIFAITISMEWLYRSLEFEEADSEEMKYYQAFRQISLQRDMVSKAVSLLLSIFVYPPFMSIGILFGLIVITIPRELR